MKDVTDVKLVPTATTGDEANKFSAAAEIRVMGRFQDEEVEVNKADLTALVEKAEGKKPLSIAVEELYNSKIKILGDDEEE